MPRTGRLRRDCGASGPITLSVTPSPTRCYKKIAPPFEAALSEYRKRRWPDRFRSSGRVCQIPLTYICPASRPSEVYDSSKEKASFSEHIIQSLRACGSFIAIAAAKLTLFALTRPIMRHNTILSQKQGDKNPQIKVSSNVTSCGTMPYVTFPGRDIEAK